MRILIFAAFYLPHVGGYIHDAHALARGLLAKGHKVEVVTCNTERSAPEEVIDGIKVIRLPCINLLGGQFPIPIPSMAMWRLRNLYPDVISTQTRFFFTSFIGALLAKIKKVPLVHTERGAMHSAVGSRLVDILGRICDHTLGSMVVRMSNVSVGVSHMSCKFIEHLGGKKTIRIPLGVDYEFMRSRAEPDHSKKIIFTGRLVYGKGVQDLISSF